MTHSLMNNTSGWLTWDAQVVKGPVLRCFRLMMRLKSQNALERILQLE